MIQVNKLKYPSGIFHTLEEKNYYFEILFEIKKNAMHQTGRLNKKYDETFYYLNDGQIFRRLKLRKKCLDYMIEKVS